MKSGHPGQRTCGVKNEIIEAPAVMNEWQQVLSIIVHLSLLQQFGILKLVAIGRDCPKVSTNWTLGFLSLPIVRRSRVKSERSVICRV
jgi:hypothetical protein